MKRIIQGLTLCLLANLSMETICLQDTSAQNESEEIATVPSKKKNTNLNEAQNIHDYWMANFYQFGGKMKLANEHFKTLFTNSAPIFAYKGYVHLLYDTKNYQHIAQLIPQLDPVFKDDQAISHIFAQVFDKIGQSTQADDRFIRLNNQFKTNQEIAFNAANSYLRRKEPENAINVIDNLLNSSPRKPNNFIFYFMKAQIYMQLNNKQEALKCVQKSIEMHPRFDKGWLLFALLNEQVGELKDAIKGYSTFLEVTGGNNREVEQHLLQLIFKQKIQDRNTKESLVMNKSCFDKALILFDQKKFQEALKQIDTCLDEEPGNDESKLLKIQILSALKQPEKIVSHLKAWITQNPNNSLWYKTLHLLTRNDLSISQAIALLKDIEKQSPQTLFVQLYLADLHTRAGSPKVALVHHEKALPLTADQQLKEKILYQMGVIYYETKNNDDLEKVIAQVNKIEATYAPLLNLAAYHYAQHEETLSQAQSLVDKVLKHDSNNPHFLDTQALIYYKQKQYPQAQQLLEKIAQIVPSDYTVLIHLAQAHYQNNDSKRALSTLEIAQQYAKTTDNKNECKQLLNQWKTKKT